MFPYFLLIRNRPSRPPCRLPSLSYYPNPSERQASKHLWPISVSPFGTRSRHKNRAFRWVVIAERRDEKQKGQAPLINLEWNGVWIIHPTHCTVPCNYYPHNAIYTAAGWTGWRYSYRIHCQPRDGALYNTHNLTLNTLSLVCVLAGGAIHPPTELSTIIREI